MRRQLPAYSPLSLSGLGLAALDAIRSPDDARAALSAHLTQRFAAERVCLTGSGTEALRLALEIAKRSRSARGGLVALPAYSCYDVVTAAVGADVRAVFYDIDPVTLSPDMESLSRAIDAGAEIVVAGNLFGFPIDWDAVRSQCDRAGALLIEDAAQGLGSGWGGREFGTFGDLTVLSFGRGKGWTGGGGGALLARGELGAAGLDEFERGVDRLPRPGAGARAAVLSGVQWCLGRPWAYGLVASLPGTGLGETAYKQPAPVTGIPAFCAAAALRHADAAQGLVTVRRAWARRWDALFTPADGAGTERSGALEPCVPLTGGACGYLRYPLLGTSADAFAARAARAGVARSYPRALPDLPEAQPVSARAAGAARGARALAAGLVTLPTHRLVDEVDVGVVESSR
ncbi:MAG: DegT/DnrJ/EryC1/StrS family aminotransferase [Gemmatimonadota bacterium]